MHPAFGYASYRIRPTSLPDGPGLSVLGPRKQPLLAVRVEAVSGEPAIEYEVLDANEGRRLLGIQKIRQPVHGNHQYEVFDAAAGEKIGGIAGALTESSHEWDVIDAERNVLGHIRAVKSRFRGLSREVRTDGIGVFSDDSLLAMVSIRGGFLRTEVTLDFAPDPVDDLDRRLAVAFAIIFAAQLFGMENG